MPYVARLCVFLLLCSSAAAAQDNPLSLYQALNTVHVDSSRVYYIRDYVLRRDVVRLVFSEGKLAFLSAVDGRVTGAVFTGSGRALAIPRDLVEKRSLARFLGAPLLDQAFSRAYLRFTDQTAEELLRLLQLASAQPVSEPGFGDEWNNMVSNLNSSHSIRVLADWLAPEPIPYFYAGLIGDLSGPFDVLLDNRRDEQVLLGQPRWVAGVRYYDVWASFPRANPLSPLGPIFVPVSFRVDTSILADRSLQGRAELTLKSLRPGERIVPLELSRHLKVESVTDAEGRHLLFFQNEEINRKEIQSLGNDSVHVILPERARADQEFQLRITYRGSVISDAGNGVYFVGDRGSWYPNTGGPDRFATFDLTFRWPRRLQLVATGRKLEEREDGDWRVGRWKSESPIPVAGFNLGEYVSETVKGDSWSIELFANRALEDAVLNRFNRAMVVPQEPRVSVSGRPPVPVTRVIVPDTLPPSPAHLLKQLGNDIADAVRFCETFNGPFPFQHLAVAQIPGSFGQGWPGLLYLSTFSFLTPEAQRRAGVGQRTQEQFTELMPFHEVAHQWWGNTVGGAGYRDMWIQEGLSNYLALLFADSKRPGHRELAGWLEFFRDDLSANVPGKDETAESAGPLVLGYRLRSSRSPASYTSVIYGKGAWVFHMLRSMLRDDSARNPDARFAQLLRSLLERHRYLPLATQDLANAVEKLMTPAMDLEGNRSMDWFFDQWVRNSGIPRYSVDFQARPASPAAVSAGSAARPPAGGKGGAGSKPAGNSEPQPASFVIRGTLRQSDVPDTFLAAVPIYAVRPSGKPLFLGTIITSGEETPFKFVVPFRPRRLLIDPNLTLLARTN